MGVPLDRGTRREPPGPPIGLVFDCADPARVGTFWRQALGYVETTPPEGYASWEELGAAGEVPADRIGYAIVDPDGARPSIFFQLVPEPKVAKNRVHLDIKLSAGVARPSEEERRRIEAGVAPLVELGAAVLRRNQDPEDWFIVMQDPEGNEFCLV
jgi:Glyoxalase-like domain